MSYSPPLEVICWHDGHGIFMTCFVAGSSVHPSDNDFFRYEGGEWTRKSTRLYWVDLNKEIEDIAFKHGHAWTPPPRVA